MSLEVDSGPQLLLDWHEGTDSVRWFRAAAASFAVHVIIVPLLVIVASMDTPPAKVGTEIVSNLHHITLITPADITQKEPNRAKPAKEVSVEDLQPQPPTKKSLSSTRAVRTFQPPTPQKPGPPRPGPDVAEPPKLEASVNPAQPLPAPAGLPNAPAPQIQTAEQPNLPLDTRGQRGADPDSSKGQSKPALKLPIQQAMRQPPTGGGGTIGGTVERPEMPESLQLPPSPGSQGILPELLSNPMGVDFKPYLAQVLALVRRNWFAIIPESARLGNRGIVQLQFMIDRSGQVPKLVIASPSGSQSLDRAAVASVSASVPFPPLPPEYKGLSIRLQFAFKYNVQ
jgi:TonB family protein